MLPDVSVIVTCYMYGIFLERCLRSLFNQEHTKRFSYEVVLVDDNSPDETERVSNKFKEKYQNFKYIRNVKNRGLAASCNIGIDLCDGRYIVRVDADDYVNRHFLWLLKVALDKNRFYQAFCCDYTECNEFEEHLRNVDACKEEIACGVMYRREFIIEIGLYNEHFEFREGHELKKRFERKYKIGHLPVPLYYVRKHSSNRTYDTDKVMKFDDKLKNA